MVRRAHVNLWPDWAPEMLWELLVKWAESRTIVCQPKGLRLPDEARRWGLAGTEAVPLSQPSFCLIPSTAPRQPSRVEEFNLAFAGLEFDQQIYVLALVELQGDPWPGGDQWAALLCSLSLTPRQYKNLLHDALRSLVAFARARRLV